MLEYADIYMQSKKKWERFAIINLFGGESMFHPDLRRLIDLLREKHSQKYKDRYHLTLTVTTNGVFGRRLLKSIINQIDSWTVSYHTEANSKQRQQCLENIKYIHDQGKPVHCNLMMHSAEDNWKDCMRVVDYFNQHNIEFIPYRVGDGGGIDQNGKIFKTIKIISRLQHSYSQDQIDWFKNYWQSKSKLTLDWNEPVETNDGRFIMRSLGRECCGGREMCINGDMKKTTKYITRVDFKDWYCSVNWYFLFVKQDTESIYVHKDCKVNFDYAVGPIATLDQADELLEKTKQQFMSNTVPMIKCPINVCACGICAPKAQTLDALKDIMLTKHVTKDVWANTEI
jgi:hypothetical protein